MHDVAQIIGSSSWKFFSRIKVGCTEESVPLMGCSVMKSCAISSIPSAEMAWAMTGGRSWRMTRPGIVGNFSLKATHWWPILPPISTKRGVSGPEFAASSFSNGKTSKKIFCPSRLAVIHEPKLFKYTGLSWSQRNGGRSVLWALWKGVWALSVGFWYLVPARNSGSACQHGRIRSWLTERCYKPSIKYDQIICLTYGIFQLSIRARWVSSS